jgi:hypothetical protein
MYGLRHDGDPWTTCRASVIATVLEIAGLDGSPAGVSRGCLCACSDRGRQQAPDFVWMLAERAPHSG